MHSLDPADRETKVTAISAKSEGATPGFNHKIPEKILTPDRVETRLGTLEFFDGMPTEATVTAVYDNLDLMRGVEAFLNGIPAASVRALCDGLGEIGVDAAHKVMLTDELMDSAPLFLTGNTDTVYLVGVLDLLRDGATVVVVPPGCGPGTVDDAFFRFVVDMGAPGPDRGAGGKYLILPPDYDGDLEGPIGGKEQSIGDESYFVVRSPSYLNLLALRGFLGEDGTPDAAVEMFKNGIAIYPLAQAGDPPAMEFISGSKKPFNTIHANNFEFYEELHATVDREPIAMWEPELLGLFSAIGIQKGKAFDPDERMKAILTEAVAIGNATARAIYLRPRMEHAYIYPDSAWYTGVVGGDYEFMKDEGRGGRYLDSRTLMFYGATLNTPAMVMKMVGVGSQYAYACTDRNGDYLDGGKTYRLHIPADVPARNFWSVVAYDPQTRSELQTGQTFPSKNNRRDKLTQNPDGSVDLYFGPRRPAQERGRELDRDRPRQGLARPPPALRTARDLVRPHVAARRVRTGQLTPAAARRGVDRRHASSWMP